MVIIKLHDDLESNNEVYRYWEMRKEAADEKMGPGYY